VNSKLAEFFGTENYKFVLSLWFLLAVNMMVMELSDVVATAGFVSELGSDYLPWLWLVMTLLTLFVAGGYSVLVDRHSRLNLITGLLLGLALLYLGLMFLLRSGFSEQIIYTLLSIISDQQYYILPLAFWALANDIFSVTEGKRIFSFIASGAVIGGLIGNSLAGYSAVLLSQWSAGPDLIFLLAAILLLFALIVIRVIFFRHTIRARQSRASDTNFRDSISVGVDYFRNVEMLQMVAVIMVLSGVALALVEFYFLRSIELNTSGDSLRFQSFLGYFKTGQTIGLLIFQWLITRHLMEKISLRNAFLFLPVFLIGAAGLSLVLTGITGVAIGRFFARTVQRGWDEPARKSLQGLIPDERRGRIALFMDTVFYNFATIFSSLVILLLLWLTRLDIISDAFYKYISLGIAFLAALIAAFAGINFRRVYERSLLNWRLARSKRKSVLDGMEF